MPRLAEVLLAFAFVFLDHVIAHRYGYKHAYLHERFNHAKNYASLQERASPTAPAFTTLISTLGSSSSSSLTSASASSSPAVASTSPTSAVGSAPSSASTTFNPLARNNVAVYIGHSPGNYNASLPQLCNDAAINIIMISFIRRFNGLNMLPTFDFAPSCDSRQVTNYTAPFPCPVLAQQISTCQSQGKKILISIGGSVSNTTLSSVQNATDTANTLWNVFGAGFSSAAPRPFGNVVIDGFDVDQESGPGTYYDTLAQTLKSLSRPSATRSYLSAAPLCANTTVLPFGFYAQTDFVWARFYNAKKCNIGTTGFLPNLQSWDNYLSSIVGVSSVYPRLLVGGISFNNSNSGYVPPENFSAAAKQASSAVSDRFGGVMLWDGTNGETTLGANGQSFIAIVKQAMPSS